MKKLMLGLVLSACASLMFAQGTTTPAATGSTGDTKQKRIEEISLSKFEDAGLWSVSMPLDEGLISRKRVAGVPAGKKALEGETAAGIKEADDYVLGVKVEFFKRGMNNFFVYAVRPLPIEGLCQTVSVWVVGRNYNHKLKLVIEDFDGVVRELYMENDGRLNHLGWKQMSVAIPKSVPQADRHYTNRSGIKIIGFKVECDPEESYGTYYLYLDGLTARTDLFAESNRDNDDVVDNW